jgi:hypothetical protein
MMKAGRKTSIPGSNPGGASKFQNSARWSHEVVTAQRSPWQNAYGERLIGFNPT